jgi:uncharacterized protein
MSTQPQNLDIVKTMYEAFAKRDINSIISLLSADVIWEEPANPHNPAAGRRVGIEGFLKWLNIGRATEEIIVLNPSKFLSDNDTFAVIGYTECLAKTTGKKYATDFVHVITIKEGKIAKFQEFFDTYIAGEAFKK